MTSDKSPSRKPYAARTEVPAEKTRAEIEVLLRGESGTRIVTMDEAGELVVAWAAWGRWYKIVVLVESHLSAQERRAKWRALLLVIKAKIEAIHQGISSLEREFLADTIMPDGQTVAEWVEPQLAKAFDSGQMPKLLPDYSGQGS
ncbi:MAG: hypothetical protein ACRYGP_13770 [Janthinobacterium lividum]